MFEQNHPLIRSNTVDLLRSSQLFVNAEVVYLNLNDSTENSAGFVLFLFQPLLRIIAAAKTHEFFLFNFRSDLYFSMYDVYNNAWNLGGQLNINIERYLVVPRAGNYSFIAIRDRPKYVNRSQMRDIFLRVGVVVSSSEPLFKRTLETQILNSEFNFSYRTLKNMIRKKRDWNICWQIITLRLTPLRDLVQILYSRSEKWYKASECLCQSNSMISTIKSSGSAINSKMCRLQFIEYNTWALNISYGGAVTAIAEHEIDIFFGVIGLSVERTPFYTPIIQLFKFE